MSRRDLNTILRILLAWCLVALLIKVTWDIVYRYGDYFPPNFESDFLVGRQSTFFGSYQIAFYSHILASPCSLLLGPILLSDRFRLRFRGWHRTLGKVVVALVLFIVVPSGLWMSAFAMTGAVAGFGFATLAVSTGLCVFLGWQHAHHGRYVEHRRWMIRCYLLLCSAIILRLMAGAFTVLGVHQEWTYPLAAWLSWLLPIVMFEVAQWISRRWPSRVTSPHSG